MNLQQIIRFSQLNKAQIIKEYETFENYNRRHPQTIENELKKLQMNGEQGVPSFNELIEYKDNYLLDNPVKVYRQIKAKNPTLNPDLGNGMSTVFCYLTEPDLAKRQLQRGLRVGESDPLTGAFVNGSDLVIECIGLNTREFLYSYYTAFN